MQSPKTVEHDKTVTRVTFSIVIGALMLTLNLLLSEYAPDNWIKFIPGLAAIPCFAVAAVMVVAEGLRWAFRRRDF